MSNASEMPRVMILDEFLVAQELGDLLNYSMGRSPDFAATGVLGAGGQSHVNQDYRRSRVIFDLEGFHDLFAERIVTYLPLVLQRLDHPEFPISQVEVQLTASNNGEFFRVHSDSDSDPVRSRALTFVYYFYREPKAFSGGELRVWGDWRDERQDIPGETSVLVHPIQNQIIFFQSNLPHEVQPVYCPSGDFADSRFTVNGWLHR